MAHNLSHPLRVRELKQETLKSVADTALSHPLRVRELKLVSGLITAIENSRTLYGCVN